MLDALKMLQALADPTRLAVFECIRGCGGASVYDTATGQCDGGTDGSVAVCTVRCQVPCSPSTLSHHLSALREAGLIETEKRGREVYARVVPQAVERLSRWLTHGPADPCCLPIPIPTQELAHR